MSIKGYHLSAPVGFVLSVGAGVLAFINPAWACVCAAALALGFANRIACGRMEAKVREKWDDLKRRLPSWEK